MHVTRRCQKHHFLGTKIWYLNPFFIWECDMSLQIFYPFIDLMHKNCIKLISIVQSACLKGSYSSDSVDLDSLFI